ncbi:MAG: ABC transporter permease [Ruminococcus sp.]|nr:ABC transporter permease [Ruminococcus sp.]
MRRTIWKCLIQKKHMLVGCALLMLIILFAFLGPYVSPYTYEQQIRGEESLPPSLEHPFGTDRLGRDLMVRCMIGTRISLLVGVLSALTVLVIGSVYGAIAGMLGGMADTIMMRVAEIIYAIPEILFIIVIKIIIEEPLEHLIENVSILRPLQKVGSSLIAIFLVYGSLYWVGMARMIRGRILQIKEMEYVMAAKALGCGKVRLLFRHLLPNCTGQMITMVTLQIPSAIFTESFLSFLGLGVAAPMASLGSLASDALNGFVSYPYRMLFPAGLISLMILIFHQLGDGLQEVIGKGG